MNIEHQLKTARTSVRKQAEELLSTWDLHITWFQDMMVAEVFGYLLKGRMKHDTYQKPCTFDELWDDVHKSKLVALYIDHGSKFLFNEFDVTMDNIGYHVEEWAEHRWHAEPSLHNINRQNLPGRIRLSSESFIRFMEEFNQVVPMIHSEATDLHVEVAKREFTDSILLQSLESIINDVLGNIDIPFSYELKNNGIVFRFWLRGHTGLRIRIPAEQYASRIIELPELLINPDAGIKRYGKDFRYERLNK